MSKIEELLSVLDMPEDEQKKWVDNNNLCKEYKIRHGTAVIVESLADVAFRLRDKTIAQHGINIWLQSQNHVRVQCAKNTYYESWWDIFAQPIHFIIAAKIAEVLGEKE